MTPRQQTSVKRTTTALERPSAAVLRHAPAPRPASTGSSSSTIIATITSSVAPGVAVEMVTGALIFWPAMISARTMQTAKPPLDAAAKGSARIKACVRAEPKYWEIVATETANALTQVHLCA